jgi:hypothetical protein
MSEHLSPRTTRFSQQGKLLIHTYLREIRPIDIEKRCCVHHPLIEFAQNNATRRSLIRQ